MKRLLWLTVEAVRAIQQELIATYGGTPGLRSAHGLEAALARPKHLVAYRPNVEVPELAAAYGWGLLRNHAFVDGNKRVAIAAVITFLELNGLELNCSEAEETVMTLRAAAGEIKERAWIRWITSSAVKKR